MCVEVQESETFGPHSVLLGPNETVVEHVLPSDLNTILGYPRLVRLVTAVVAPAIAPGQTRLGSLSLVPIGSEHLVPTGWRAVAVCQSRQRTPKFPPLVSPDGIGSRSFWPSRLRTANPKCGLGHQSERARRCLIIAEASARVVRCRYQPPGFRPAGSTIGS